MIEYFLMHLNKFQSYNFTQPPIQPCTFEENMQYIKRVLYVKTLY